MAGIKRLFTLITIFTIGFLSVGTLASEGAQFSREERTVTIPDQTLSTEEGYGSTGIMGMIPFRYNGFMETLSGCWLVEDGIITMDRTGLVEGEISGEKNWWYLEGSKVIFDADTMAKKEDGWWKVTDGRIDHSFTGIEKNSKGFWYFKDGKLDFNYCAIEEWEGREWLVVRGKAWEIACANDMTLYRAFKVIENITTESMTQEEKLKACYDYVQKMTELNPRLPHYTGEDWPMIYAEDVFMNKEGNCLSFASALAYMAKALGYKDVYVCSSGEHGWAEIDGLIYDPEWALHHFEYNYYALSYDEPTDQNYRETISWADQPGLQWMRIKL